VRHTPSKHMSEIEAAADRPLDGYIRVSRVGDRSGESYISPAVQESSLRGWAAHRGVGLVVHPPEENVSGGTMDRPVFNRVMERIRSGESAGIVVYKLDRFARTLVGGLTVFQELAERDALFASATEPAFDFSTPGGRMFLSMNLMLAEYFREQAKESWATSIGHAVGRGVHIAPTVGYGYGKGPDKRLVVGAAAPFAARAFELRAQGWPYARIADWLNAHAPAREDGRPWVANTVRRMVQRRVYLGEARWGAVVNPAAHEPIVTVELWERANRRVQPHSRKRKGEDMALLHGIARCAGCRFQLSRARTVSGGHDRQYYRCRGQRVSGTCSAPAAVRADRDDGLEAYVERVVCAELDRLADSYYGVSDVDAVRAAEAQLHEAQAELEELRADVTARRRLGSRWLGFVEPYLDAVEQAERRLQELRDTDGSPVVGWTSDAYRALSRPDRAEFLREAIDCVMVRNVGGPRGPQAVPIDADRVQILWHGTGPADLPRRNKVSPLEPWPWPEAKPPARKAA
jgi:DNA invertase Pin-like site-specific DNA recombinase